MELVKYYSLDECSDREELFYILNEMKDDSKIEYKILDYDAIRIYDIGLSDNGLKKFLKLLDKLDVMPYPDYEDIHEMDYDGMDDIYEEEDYE